MGAGNRQSGGRFHRFCSGADPCRKRKTRCLAVRKSSHALLRALKSGPGVFLYTEKTKRRDAAACHPGVGDRRPDIAPW